jgi:SSS family solute:Na+ symporter
MTGVQSHFTLLDWAILGGYLLLTTWIGHALRGRQATIGDFFLAGRSLPWPAVCGSIIATEISALTFIGVPGTVFALTGNFTYLQWAIGSVIARFIVGIWFVRVFFERDIFSPYDYMQERLGRGARALTTGLFFLSSVLGQSVRLLITALILRTVTGLDFQLCIFIIGAFALLWTLMGGMTTVIWTDVVQFAVLLLGGIFAFGWLMVSINGGLPEFLRAGAEAGKFRLIDLTTDPTVQYTLWVGIFAMPFQNLAAFGTDQLNAQRMFCCRNSRDAGKAIIFSCLGQFVTILMLFVGAALFVYYNQHPPTPGEAALFAEDRDYVFPVFLTTVVPPGVTGLILAGAFAAAISSLDSALAALAQTSVSLVHGRNRLEESHQKKLLVHSRIAVVFWAILLPLVAIGIQAIRGDLDLISLAFGMVSYTYGPMLGAFLLAMSPLRRDIRGVWIGAVLSILLVLWVRPDLYNILAKLTATPAADWLAYKPKLSFVWLYPITCLLTLGCGILLGRKPPTGANPPPTLSPS